MNDSSATRQDGVRLQKVLATAGLASRRACEVMIDEGRVEVNGRVVTEQGLRVDPERDVIRVDGSRIPPPRRHLYLVVNKPRGVVSTMDDPEGRRNLSDLLEGKRPGKQNRLFHVGRLDTETDGLLILTNDGELGHRITHPSFEVPKTYLAKVHGNVARDVGRRLREGVGLDDGLARLDSFRLVDHLPGHSLVEVVLHEGRKHIVRRLLDAVGYPVERLVRTAIGEVRLGDQRPGKVRPLTQAEVGGLYKAVGM